MIRCINIIVLAIILGAFAAIGSHTGYIKLWVAVILFGLALINIVVHSMILYYNYRTKMLQLREAAQQAALTAYLNQYPRG